jgi:hypothetical protein
MYPAEIADVAEDWAEGRWRVQLKPEKEVTVKVVSKT